MQLRWSGHLVRMDDERLPKRLFYGDVATGYRRQGGQIRRYKDTLKFSLKRLQINPTNWEELVVGRLNWRRKVNTGAAIYKANRIAAAKVKREARKSQVRPNRNSDVQPLPTCPRCQRIFRTRIGLIGHLRNNCTSHTAPTAVPPPASFSSFPPPTNSAYSFEPSLPSSSSSPPPPPPPPLFLLLLLLLLLLPPLPLPPAQLHQPRPLWWPSLTPASHTSMTQQQTPSLQPPTPGVRTRTTPALTATAPSPHTSACSATCESIAQRLASQCQEHLPTPIALASAAHTAVTPSRIAWAYSATCAFTRAELTVLPTRPPRQTTSPVHHPLRPYSLSQVTPTTPTLPAETVHTHSPLASAWLVTCESIARRLANRCLQHQPMPAKLASTAYTALALSRIAWAYSATCASTTTCVGSTVAINRLSPNLPN
nr:unnamed protein product [Spirometra erinaceieuropaei]